MQRIAGWALAAWLATGVCAAAPVPAPQLTAAQIVAKNAEARGGVDAWRRIQSMAWAGHVESAAAPERNLPFLLELQRPNKTRFEIMAASQKSVRIFDGAEGWKLRPSSSGGPDVQRYTPEEVRFAQDAPLIDGPLMDAAAKGAAFTLERVEEIEGRRTYLLHLRLLSGANQHVWVDAETFLESRFERERRTAQGQPGAVSVAYRNYHAFEGVQIPLSIETGTPQGKATDKLVIEKVALNPRLDERAFARPIVTGTGRGKATVDTRVPPPPMPPRAVSPKP